ncbi:MAG: zf-HC2 domain-containing protein [Deltaproteobacteria bacterium]|nr:zf-HC2 domain-containing protein [Deltaproteobacteria bacterium]
MECKEVRDRFSSLFEGELKPSEEERIREHLGSCQDCQKEWEQFNRMIHWLHTVEEEEAPEGFLSEIQKKREERKGRERRGGDRFFRSMKIPVQAAAMVMIVFLALYLTKMTPFDMLQKRAVEKPEVLQSDREKKEPVLKEEEGQKVTTPLPELYRENYLAEAKPSVADEKVSDQGQVVQKMKEEDKEPPAPPLKEEMATTELVRPKEMAKAEAPRLEEKRREGERVGRVTMSLAQKTAREITLKISDRERAISRIQELAKQLGGKVVKEDGDVLLASLPASTLAEFEKELAQVGFPPSAPKAGVQKEMKDDSKLAAGTKSTEPEAKGKEPSRSAVPRENIISIRIHLVPE